MCRLLPQWTCPNALIVFGRLRHDPLTGELVPIGQGGLMNLKSY